MASGVKVNKECLVKYDMVKMKKTLRWTCFKLNEKMTEIVVAEEGARDSTFQDFQDALVKASEEGHCRYAAYDLDYVKEGMNKDKILFVHWASDNAKGKEKMVATSSKDYLKKALQLTVEVQANDVDDLSLENFEEKAKRT